jgi:hypothetical protein
LPHADDLVARRLLAVGPRIGADALISIRGRRTGLPRSTPITIRQNAGRRDLIMITMDKTLA